MLFTIYKKGFGRYYVGWEDRKHMLWQTWIY